MSVTRCPEGQSASCRLQTRSVGEEDGDGSHAATAAGLRAHRGRPALKGGALGGEPPPPSAAGRGFSSSSPGFRPLERGLFSLLASKLRHWREATLLVISRTLFSADTEGGRLLWSRGREGHRNPGFREKRTTSSSGCLRRTGSGEPSESEASRSRPIRSANGKLRARRPHGVGHPLALRIFDAMRRTHASPAQGIVSAEVPAYASTAVPVGLAVGADRLLRGSTVRARGQCQDRRFCDQPSRRNHCPQPSPRPARPCQACGFTASRWTVPPVLELAHTLNTAQMETLQPPAVPRGADRSVMRSLHARPPRERIPRKVAAHLLGAWERAGGILRIVSYRLGDWGTNRLGLRGRPAFR